MKRRNYYYHSEQKKDELNTLSQCVRIHIYQGGNVR